MFSNLHKIKKKTIGLYKNVNQVREILRYNNSQNGLYYNEHKQFADFRATDVLWNYNIGP